MESEKGEKSNCPDKRNLFENAATRKVGKNNEANVVSRKGGEALKVTTARKKVKRVRAKRRGKRNILVRLSLKIYEASCRWGKRFGRGAGKRGGGWQKGGQNHLTILGNCRHDGRESQSRADDLTHRLPNQKILYVSRLVRRRLRLPKPPNPTRLP